MQDAAGAWINFGTGSRARAGLPISYNSVMALNILLSGATGRIGREIERVAAGDAELEIVDRASGGGFFSESTAADVLIDFSRPELCARSLQFAETRGIACVIGTTGLDAPLQARVRSAAHSVPVCQAANFSLGVNALMELAQVAATRLGIGFDVEISELHHRRKADAPSGTALALGRAVAEARGQVHNEVAVFRRDGEREKGQIGYESMRGGDVAGEHTVLFLGDGERIELTHRAADRALFARGALHAARWLVGRPAGLYSMRDVLG